LERAFSAFWHSLGDPTEGSEAALRRELPPSAAIRFCCDQLRQVLVGRRERCGEQEHPDRCERQCAELCRLRPGVDRGDQRRTSASLPPTHSTQLGPDHPLARQGWSYAGLLTFS
jgi:hypothetical protein